MRVGTVDRISRPGLDVSIFGTDELLFEIKLDTIIGG